jgi:hypothetical protein
VELIAQMTQDNARQISELTREISEHSRQAAALRDASASLLQIAQIHQEGTS